ncbi:MAG: isopentenyl phosphate kinase [Candidatus Micrarchaeaceae archaeon]
MKIGGSAISDKLTGESFVEEVGMRVARELDRNASFVIIQGAGYIGHRIAIERRVSRLADNQEAWAYLRYKIAETANETLRILISNELPVVYLPANAFITTNNGKVSWSNYDIINGYLDRGFIPFMHSDGAIDSKLGLSVLSGDAIASDIAAKLRAKMLIFGTDVDGVKMRDGRIISRIDNIDINGAEIREIANDVSGGMQNKILEAKNSGIEARIVNLRKDGSLSNLLRA